MPVGHGRMMASESHGVAVITATGLTDWQVPPGVNSVKLTCNGAKGNDYGIVAVGGVEGGNGGRAIGTLAVSPGELLHVFIGGGGDTNVIYDPNTAKGGHAADVRQGGTALGNRKIVGAGGGGGGAESGLSGGIGPGGDGGAAVGGRPQHDDHGDGTNGQVGSQGGGGTQAAGGKSPSNVAPYNGSSGQGGNGRNQGGGGGGGYFGGGGGDGTVTGPILAVGCGGGGSNYVGGAGLSATTSTRGANTSRTASVMIEW